MKTPLIRSSSGFTLLEVIVTGVILAVASFGIYGALAVSESMARRSNIEMRRSQIFQERAQYLVRAPFSLYRDVASTNTPSGNNTWSFQSGALAGRLNIYPVWPFPLPADEGSTPTSYRYLFRGNPLPGQTNTRDFYSFREKVSLHFSGAYTNATYVDVTYIMKWSADFEPSRSPYQETKFTFRKYDPSRL